MSRKNAGICVKFTNKEGETKNGVVRHVDQNNVLKARNKLLVRVADDNWNVDEKADLICKSEDMVIPVGFID